MKKINKSTYWTLSFTWGIVMTLVGIIASIGLLFMGKKPERNQYGFVFKIGKGWGGLSLGPCAIVSEDASQHTLNHEFGHSIQNCQYGFLMVAITLASVFRYHYRNWVKKHKPNQTLPPYDSIWFEGEASSLGNFYKDGE